MRLGESTRTQPRREQCSSVISSITIDMDYEGFRQMVLGANLFSIKTKELMKFSEGKDDEPPERILNAALLSFNKESKQTTAIVETSQ